jgi:hypothetical protein
VVKVLDFGLAKATREGPLDGGLTHEGQMLGTPDYIAPEQSLDAHKADIRADIYSLGCTLYYLLSGGPPFRGSSLYEVLQAHHSMEARPLNLMRPEVPSELAAVVRKMIAKEPSRRYQTPGEVAQALKPFFKPGEGGAVGAKAEVEVSKAGQSIPAQGTAIAAATPSQAARSAPPPAPVVPTPAASAPVGPMWEHLIDTSEAEAVSAEVRTVEPAMNRGNPPWMWLSGAACVMTIGVFLGWWFTVGTDQRKSATAEPGPPTASRPQNVDSSGSIRPNDGTGAWAQTEADGRSLTKDGDASGTPNPSDRAQGTRSGQIQSRKTNAHTSVENAQPVTAAGPAKPRELATASPDTKATLDRAPATLERVGTELKEAGKGRRSQRSDIRLVEPFPDLKRLPDPDAVPPDGGFWPTMTPGNLQYWQIADPNHVKMHEKGVRVEAGPSGNLLLTRRENYKKCKLKLTLAATKGTDAFLVLRAHRSPQGYWQAVTMRVYERENGIRVGNQSLDFQVEESGQGAVEAAPEKPFMVEFQINESNVARLKVRQRATSSASFGSPRASDYVGAVGLFVKAGALMIERMDVRDSWEGR